ncbi:MAG: hypothetical protein JRH13_08295 [Deltaproteobacteria bacterium]|nr:hypothetical protein [Deltaproteobacteria bacterium]MBW2015946.1 hypothetical protein [Deltaproteobacteria bacterium]MBW2129352.1 hypothetical protein [Deltaproteobacteria bacterium]MBW2302321.1 hypothetical protein [Deltaproteobacteria bacterium]
MSDKDLPKKIKVMAYSGYKANERPLYFFLDEKRITVKEVIDRWYGPECDYYKVLADNETVYMIKWHRTLGVWLLVKIFEKIGKH